MEREELLVKLVQVFLEQNERSVSVGNRVFSFSGHFGVSLVKPSRQEYGVPAEGGRSSWFDDGAVGYSVKEDGFSARAWGVGEGAFGVGRLVGKCGEHFGQTSGTKLFKEPFDVWAGQAVERVEAKTGIFGDDRTINDLCRLLAFVDRDLSCSSLDFWQIDVSAQKGYFGVCAQDLLDLLELVLIAGHESYIHPLEHGIHSNLDLYSLED
ncbi:hypothetical protein AYI69_g11255 [Smittium culicis]|uniref:Uncharacterized protein n=1 Tax=Smittium culicis TaxID=133412 RepID=A0A1R1WZZ2_9FUNG|nr:hypothetical protein AYI69_g11255 [Smittium culicis]